MTPKSPLLVVLITALVVLCTSYIFAHNVTTRRLGDLSQVQPTSISVEAPRGPDVEDQLIIYQDENGDSTLALTPKQMCDICHTTIDTGAILLRRGIILNSQPKSVRDELIKQHGVFFTADAEYDKKTGKLLWNSEDMADEVCERAMGHFKPHYTLGCHDIVANYHEQLWKPFNHKDLYSELLNDTSVLNYKLDFCYQTHMCVTGIGLVEEQRPCPENTPKNRSKCQSCVELANDARMVFKRLMTTIPNPENDESLREKCMMSEQNFDGFKSIWCDSLSLRHFLADRLVETCQGIVENPKIAAGLYNVVKDGNTLHRLLKDPELWEETFCTKVTNLCTKSELQGLYDMWDEAADFDYNITQARYVLDSHLANHRKTLDELEEEYFYTPRHMYHPDPHAMSEDEVLEYKERVKEATRLEKLAQQGEDIDLDVGNDEEDERIKGVKYGSEEEEEKARQYNEDIRKSEEESDTILSPELGRRLLGKLSHVDEKGVRVPNELPAHILREYKAKRHKMIHDVKHLHTVDDYQKKLQVQKDLAPKYEGNRRVWALPDSMLVSKRMSEILTRVVDLQYARDKGKVAEQLIHDTYAQQMKEMAEFSANHTNTNYEKLYDIDLDDLGNIDLSSYADPVIDNEAELASTSKGRETKKSHKDEL